MQRPGSLVSRWKDESQTGNTRIGRDDGSTVDGGAVVFGVGNRDLFVMRYCIGTCRCQTSHEGAGKPTPPARIIRSLQ